MTINKRVLMRLVAEDVGMRQFEVKKIINSLFSSIRNCLLSNNRVEIRGFGVFDIKIAKAKPKARNMRTGEFIYIPKHRKTYFRPGGWFRTMLNKSLEDDK
jgi:nucleoid DNA-binding protein